MRILSAAIILLLSSFILPHSTYKGVYNTEKGEVDLLFNLMVGQMEANTNEASSTLDVSTEDVLFNMKVNSFRFSNPILEEQFKEVYMEADKYPQTTFKGKIKQKIDFTKKEDQKVSVVGALSMHGVSKDKTIPATITMINDKIHVKSEFHITASEYGINIPAAFFSNGKDDIVVVLDAIYSKD